MKKINPLKIAGVSIGAIILLIIVISLNTASGRRWMKDMGSEFGGGLHREILVYNANGSVIYEARGKFDISFSEGRLQYVDENNLKHNIYMGYNATVIVNELP